MVKDSDEFGNDVVGLSLGDAVVLVSTPAAPVTPALRNCSGSADDGNSRKDLRELHSECIERMCELLDEI